MRFLTASDFLVADTGPSDADQNRICKPDFGHIKWALFY